MTWVRGALLPTKTDWYLADQLSWAYLEKNKKTHTAENGVHKDFSLKLIREPNQAIPQNTFQQFKNKI